MKISFSAFATTAFALGLAASASAIDLNVGLRIGAPPPVIVHTRPPRPVVERMSVAPGPGYIWIRGHHAWRGNAWVWVPGVWVLPPQAGATWIEGRWDERSGSWIDGYWSVPPPPPPPVIAEPVGVIEAPPPPRHEVIITRPSSRHVWIAGYWAWHGHHHEWVPGHWELPPRGRSVWIAPRWERRGGSYVFIEGTWR